jgi:hypothetical protein
MHLSGCLGRISTLAAGSSLPCPPGIAPRGSSSLPRPPGIAPMGSSSSLPRPHTSSAPPGGAKSDVPARGTGHGGRIRGGQEGATARDATSNRRAGGRDGANWGAGRSQRGGQMVASGEPTVRTRERARRVVLSVSPRRLTLRTAVKGGSEHRVEGRSSAGLGLLERVAA